MKHSFRVLTLLILLVSCNRGVEKPNTNSSPIFVESPDSLKSKGLWPGKFTNQIPKPSHRPAEVTKLQTQFSNWQKRKIQSGEFLSKDHCNPSWVADHPETPWLAWGFPDPLEMTFSYADLNEDHHLDLMVAFTPDQCDGGNGSITLQWQVFVVSKGMKYKTIADLNNGLAGYLASDPHGYEEYDSIGPGIIYGRHMAFLKSDGHCCPSVNSPTIYEWPTRKVLFSALPSKHSP